MNCVQNINVAKEKFRCIGIVAYPIGSDSVIVQVERKKTRKIISNQSYELLASCQSFATIEEHSDHFCKMRFGNSRWGRLLNRLFARQFLEHKRKLTKPIENELHTLAEMGLLDAYSELVEGLRSGDREVLAQSQAPIETIGFVTRDRIESLNKSVHSYIKNSQTFSRPIDIAVMDGSLDRTAQDSCREVLKQLSRDLGVDIYYGGTEERASFSSLLIKRGLPSEAVNFALFDIEKLGHAPGINRNALLLHTIGDKIFTADDDTICKVGRTANTTGRFALGQGDPTQTDFYPDRKSAFENLEFVEEDILGIHENMLGQDIPTCIANLCHNRGFDFGDISSQFYQRLFQPDSRVLITFNGLVGDCGWGSANYLWMNKLSLEKLVKSESSYIASCTSREVIREVSNPTISDAGFCMTTFAGVDNRELLPPFMPVLRDQDGIWGATIWKCLDSSLLGHLPGVLVHSPVDQRSFSRDDLSKIGPVLHLNALIKHLIFGYEPSATGLEPSSNLQSLGKRLMDLGKINPQEFKGFVSRQIIEMASNRLHFLDFRLRTISESPEYWIKDVERYQQALQEHLLNPNLWLESIAGYQKGSVNTLLQRLIFGFGQLLYWWSDICEATRELRYKGYRLAKKL